MADRDDDEFDGDEGTDEQSGANESPKDKNRRADGSYIVGKNRAPVEHRFAAGDGRKRGRRAKGVKNLKTAMRIAMNKRMTLKGKRKPGVEWVAEQVVVRAITGSDRAVEILLRNVGDDDHEARGALSKTDQEVLDEYFRQRFALETGVSLPAVSDDLDDEDGAALREQKGDDDDQ